MTSGTTDHNTKLKLMHALPLALEYAVLSARWLVTPSSHASFRNRMPLKVTVSVGALGLLPGYLQGPRPSATLTSSHFFVRFVPGATGRFRRPPASVSPSVVASGGYLKLNAYVLFTYVFQTAGGVPVAVGMGVGLAVGVGVAAAPATLMSTNQDFAASAPMPNAVPPAFWNYQ